MNDRGVKRLPGAPWDEAYIRDLIFRDGWRRVIANGYEYTRTDRVRTAAALDLLNGGEGVRDGN